MIHLDLICYLGYSNEKYKYIVVSSTFSSAIAKLFCEMLRGSDL